MVVKIEDVTLAHIDAEVDVSRAEIVRAAAYAARRGWGNRTVYRFVTLLSMSDNLRNPEMWPEILKQIDDLTTAADLAALMGGESVTGETRL